MTSQKVDSDLRTLFAIGKLDDFEKLKKECSESAVVLKGIEARIQERLKIFRNMSPREVSPIGTLVSRGFTFLLQWWWLFIQLCVGNGAKC